MNDIPRKVIADPHTRYGFGPAATRSFILQRVTGALNVLFAGFLIWLVVSLAGADRAMMVEALRSPWVWIPLVLLLVNVPIHMRIGMHEVIEDYVHEPQLNHFSLTLNTVFALAVALIGLGAVLKIVFWG